MTPYAQPTPGSVHEAPTLEFFEGQQLRSLYASVPSSVVAICALIDGAPDGMAASSLVPVSIDPPLVSFCVQSRSRTWPRMRAGARLGVSVLARSQRSACTDLARRDGDRFAHLPWSAHEHGAVFINGAAAYFSCVVESEMVAGDHVLVLLRVVLGSLTGESPIIFHNSTFGSVSAIGVVGAPTR
ncbi:MAG TPA: flavin reductase family protein [Aldersonia sp.]